MVKLVQWLATEFYHLGSNPSLGMSEVCFIFHFTAIIIFGGHLVYHVHAQKWLHNINISNTLPLDHVGTP